MSTTSQSDKKTILVTGGGGFIGSHACVALLETDDYNVVAMDNSVNCYTEARLGVPEPLIRAQILAGRRLEFIAGDLLCLDSLENVFKEIIKLKGSLDAVMHFAALKAVGESCAKPLEYYRNNVSGTMNLLEMMEKYECTKLIYSSSATVYGDPVKLPITEDCQVGVGITNPYGKSKFMTEQILMDLAAVKTNWGIISLRYFNPVGAHSSGLIGEDPVGPPNNLVPYVAQVAAGKLPFLRVFGSDYETPDGTGVRDYIHIQDLIDGHMKALELLLNPNYLELPEGRFRTYNLGTGKGYSVLEVVKAFEKVSKKKIPYEIVERRPGDIAEIYCDASLALKELGWISTRDLLEMCEDVWRWQRSNPNGFRIERSPTCLLHSPDKINKLLETLKDSSLADQDRMIHLKMLDKLEEKKILEGLMTLNKLRKSLANVELSKLNSGVGLCAGPTFPLPFCSCLHS